MPTEEEIKNMSPEEIARLQEENCVFCKIVKGDVPAKIVYNDKICTAFLDINPASLGHMLLVPNNHYQIMPQVPETELMHLGVVSKHLSHACIKGMKSKGVDSTSIFIANGAIAGQKAPHVIVHIIPRVKGDGLDKLSLKKNKMKDDDLRQIAGIMIQKINSSFGMDMKLEEESKTQENREKPSEEETREKPSEEDARERSSQEEATRESQKESQQQKQEKSDLDKISRLFGV